MIDYKYVDIPTTVDSLRVTTSSKAPRLHIRKSVTDNIPISGYLTFRYIRGGIDYLVADYHVPGENRIIPNMNLDDLKRHLTNGTLPGCLLLDINDTSRTVREAMLLEMEEMGFIYPKAVQHTAF